VNLKLIKVDEWGFYIRPFRFVRHSNHNFRYLDLVAAPVNYSRKTFSKFTVFWHTGAVKRDVKLLFLFLLIFLLLV
jgi:hypothetical protein